MSTVAMFFLPLPCSAAFHSVAVLVHNACALQMSDLQHCVIDLAHGVADDYLILTVGLNDLDNAVGLVQDVGVGLAFVLELEAKPGDAVGDAVDVLFAAYILNNDAGQSIILACHD